MLLMLLLLIRINSCCCWKADNLAGLVRQHVLLDLPHHHQPRQHLLQREPDGVVECYLIALVVILSLLMAPRSPQGTPHYKLCLPFVVSLWQH